MTACARTAKRLGYAVLLLLVPLVARAEPEVHDRDGISYVSGGVSDDELHALEAMSERFNLKLTMALTSGHFVADTPIVIQDAKGQTVLDTVADGPLLFAKLPAGTYTVRCSYHGKQEQRTAHVSAGKQERIEFTWTSE